MTVAEVDYSIQLKLGVSSWEQLHAKVVNDGTMTGEQMFAEAKALCSRSATGVNTPGVTTELTGATTIVNTGRATQPQAPQAYRPRSNSYGPRNGGGYRQGGGQARNFTPGGAKPSYGHLPYAFDINGIGDDWGLAKEMLSEAGYRYNAADKLYYGANPYTWTGELSYLNQKLVKSPATVGGAINGAPAGDPFQGDEVNF